MQKDRLDPRAHIGYLVGYHASNIWKIWIPSLDKIILSRDVEFDETKHYSESYEAMPTQDKVQRIIQVIEIPDPTSTTRRVRDHDIPEIYPDITEENPTLQSQDQNENQHQEAQDPSPYGLQEQEPNAPVSSEPT